MDPFFWKGGWGNGGATLTALRFNILQKVDGKTLICTHAALWLVRGKAPSAILGSRIPIELSTHSPQECGEWEGTGVARVKNVGEGDTERRGAKREKNPEKQAEERLSRTDV